VDGRGNDPMARAPDETHHGDVVVLRDLTDLALGHARQVEHHDASAVERNEHLTRGDVGDTSLEAKDGLLLSADRRRPHKRQDERSQHDPRVAPGSLHERVPAMTVRSRSSTTSQATTFHQALR